MVVIATIGHTRATGSYHCVNQHLIIPIRSSDVYELPFLFLNIFITHLSLGQLVPFCGHHADGPTAAITQP